MQVARVFTNRTCNQNCTFCNARRPEEDPAFVRRDAVLERIRAALGRGATEIVLTGGEPTMRRDLEDLVAAAKRLGAERVTLETNAVLVTAERAVRLAQAGLDRVRVHVPGVGTDYDATTRDEGGYEQLLAGLGALADGGLPLQIAVPIVRRNAESAAAIVRGIAAVGIPLAQLYVGVPFELPDPEAVCSLEDAASAVEALERAARLEGIPVALASDTAIPPCVFERPARLAHLYSLTPGGAERPGYEHLAACTECEVSDRCPGIPSAALVMQPDIPLHPITDDRSRRRLSVISSVEDQIERELVTREICRRPDGSARPMHTIRINFQCNQSCHFCFVSTHLPAADEERVREAIREGGRTGGIVALSGGEPTLNPRLTEYVRLARSSGASEVELQTNATRLADPALTASLVEAGVDVAFVSLHGASALVSDSVTDSPGTFERTVRGIDRLHESPIQLRLNFVFCRANYRDFPDFVRLVAARWPGTRVVISFVAPSTDLVPRTEELIPRYSDVLPLMAEGLRLARELGVPTTGFESMCGLPLCLVPDDLACYLELSAIAEGIDGGEFDKPEPCRECALTDRCYGLRRGYRELYGVAELKPVARDAVSSSRGSG